jgi:hypothetical protein
MYAAGIFCVSARYTHTHTDPHTDDTHLSHICARAHRPIDSNTRTHTQHDTRGLPIYCRQWQAPALSGSCLWCECKGYQLKGSGTTAYYGALAALPHRHALRQEMIESVGQRNVDLASENENDPRRVTAHAHPWKPTTKQGVRRRQQKAEELAARKKNTRVTRAHTRTHTQTHTHIAHTHTRTHCMCRRQVSTTQTISAANWTTTIPPNRLSTVHRTVCGTRSRTSSRC